MLLHVSTHLTSQPGGRSLRAPCMSGMLPPVSGKLAKLLDDVRTAIVGRSHYTQPSQRATTQKRWMHATVSQDQPTHQLTDETQLAQLKGSTKYQTKKTSTKNETLSPRSNFKPRQTVQYLHIKQSSSAESALLQWPCRETPENASFWCWHALHGTACKLLRRRSRGRRVITTIAMAFICLSNKKESHLLVHHVHKTKRNAKKNSGV